MAYKKTTWRNTVKDAQGNVIERRTSVNSANLNKVEEGIVIENVQ